MAYAIEEGAPPTLCKCKNCIFCDTHEALGRPGRNESICRQRSPDKGRKNFPIVDPETDWCADGVTPYGEPFSQVAENEAQWPGSVVRAEYGKSVGQVKERATGRGVEFPAKREPTNFPGAK